MYPEMMCILSSRRIALDDAHIMMKIISRVKNSIRHKALKKPRPLQYAATA